MLVALLIPIGLAVIVYAAMLLRAAAAARAVPRIEGVILGAITNFFDTLGIGSFAPTMAWLKVRKLVPDRLIPCTMLVGHTLPTLAQAIIFLILLGVLVDPVLLTGCIFALLLGGLMGAPLVAKTKVWIVQLVVACALILAASLYAMTNLNMMPGGGTASSLPLTLMVIAIIANFVFGVLLNFGIGNYAPTLVMFSLMGMDPRLSFPIMAGGAAMAAAGASARHFDGGDRPAHGDRHGDRRRPGRLRCRLHREKHAGRNAPLDGDRRRSLCRADDAPRRDGRSPQTADTRSRSSCGALNLSP